MHKISPKKLVHTGFAGGESLPGKDSESNVQVQDSESYQLTHNVLRPFSSNVANWMFNEISKITTGKVDEFVLVTQLI